jgi:hypothetical protein
VTQSCPSHLRRRREVRERVQDILDSQSETKLQPYACSREHVLLSIDGTMSILESSSSTTRAVLRIGTWIHMYNEYDPFSVPHLDPSISCRCFDAATQHRTSRVCNPGKSRWFRAHEA